MTKEQLIEAWGQKFFDECYSEALEIIKRYPGPNDVDGVAPPDLVLAAATKKIHDFIMTALSKKKIKRKRKND